MLLVVVGEGDEDGLQVEVGDDEKLGHRIRSPHHVLALRLSPSPKCRLRERHRPPPHKSPSPRPRTGGGVEPPRQRRSGVGKQAAWGGAALTQIALGGGAGEQRTMNRRWRDACPCSVRPMWPYDCGREWAEERGQWIFLYIYLGLLNWVGYGGLLSSRLHKLRVPDGHPWLRIKT